MSEYATPEELHPNALEAARDEADRGRPAELPDPYRCIDPWCPARKITPLQVAGHALDGCRACADGRPCDYLDLQAQEPHLHGTRPDGVRV